MGTVSTDASYTFTVTGNRSLTAVFEPLTPHYTITIIIDPPGSGTVTGAGPYESGQAVTLAYTAADNYNFSGWYNASGELLSTSNPYTFTATENLSITAKAVYIPVYTITASIDPAGAGTVTGTGQYQEGATVTLTAEINDGYKFTGWRENGQTVSSDNPYTFTAAADRAFTAAFAEKPTSRLPDGYTELKYIENTDMLSGINTGVNGYYARTRVTMDLEPLSDNISNTCAICATNRILYSSSAGYYYLYLISNINLNLTARIGVTKSVGTLPQSGRCIIDFNPKGKYVGVDGANVTMSVPTMKKSFGSIYLLKPPTQYAGGSASYGLPCKLYSAQVYYNEALYRDFVPCIDPNGDIGLFDLVNSAFYKDAFTGGVGFSAGPAV